jgi:hypothetical protein
MGVTAANLSNYAHATLVDDLMVTQDVLEQT